MRKTTVLLGLIIAASPFAPALALPLTYLLVQGGSGPPEQLVDGLGNCLGLTHRFVDETIVRLECDSLAYLNTALTDIAKKPGVTQVTVWTVRSD